MPLCRGQVNVYSLNGIFYATSLNTKMSQQILFSPVRRGFYRVLKGVSLKESLRATAEKERSCAEDGIILNAKQMLGGGKLSVIVGRIIM